MVSPILWQSKKIPRVTKSSLASETLGVREAVDAGNLIANVMMEVYRLDKSPTVTCYTDGNSLKTHLQSSNKISDLRVNMARLRQMVERGYSCVDTRTVQCRGCADKEDSFIGSLVPGTAKWSTRYWRTLKSSYCVNGKSERIYVYTLSEIEETNSKTVLV